MKCIAREWDREMWSYKEKVRLGMQIPSHVLGSLDYLLKHTAEIDEKHTKINRGTKTPSMVAR